MTVLLVACALDRGAGFFVIKRHLSHATVSVFFFFFPFPVRGRCFETGFFCLAFGACQELDL